MHGRDLGYDNKITAIKTWGYFYLHLVIGQELLKLAKKKKQKNSKTPTIKESIKSIKDSLEQYELIQNEKKLIEQWKPRILNANIDFKPKGHISDYQEGSPERALVEYIEYLLKGNYGKMALLTTKLFSSNDSIKNLPEK